MRWIAVLAALGVLSAALPLEAAQKRVQSPVYSGAKSVKSAMPRSAAQKVAQKKATKAAAAKEKWRGPTVKQNQAQKKATKAAAARPGRSRTSPGGKYGGYAPGSRLLHRLRQVPSAVQDAEDQGRSAIRVVDDHIGKAGQRHEPVGFVGQFRAQPPGAGVLTDPLGRGRDRVPERTGGGRVVPGDPGDGGEEVAPRARRENGSHL